MHYCLHGFRRGHAQELVESGCDLLQILRAGEWASPVFLCYLGSVKYDFLRCTRISRNPTEMKIFCAF